MNIIEFSGIYLSLKILPFKWESIKGTKQSFSHFMVDLHSIQNLNGSFVDHLIGPPSLIRNFIHFFFNNLKIFEYCSGFCTFELYFLWSFESLKIVFSLSDWIFLISPVNILVFINYLHLYIGKSVGNIVQTMSD